MTNTNLKARLGMTAALSALLLTAFVSHAHAAGSSQDAPFAGSLSASASMDLDSICTPPSDFAACAAWHKVIRENFSQREIGILFGTATSYPGYLTSYWQVKSRYQRLHDEFSEGRPAGDKVSAR